MSTSSKPLQTLQLLSNRSVLALSMVAALSLRIAQADPVAFQSGVYQTLPGATVQERGDRVQTGNRIMPISAIIKLDFRVPFPSLVAAVPNAILEGGDPFFLTIRSSSGGQLPDGRFNFTGDYLADLYPQGTQYGFSWYFSPTNDGRIVWNGMIGWFGGHLWNVTISNLTLVLQPWLEIIILPSRQAALTWPTNFISHTLEYSTNLVNPNWIAVTNSLVPTGDLLSVTVDLDTEKRFYRLRGP